MRSPMTSRSNCGNDKSTLRVRRPHRRRRVELLGDRNKGRASRVEDLDDLGKISERAGQPVNLVDDDRIDPPRSDVGEQPLQSGPIDRRAGEPTVIISLGQTCPAFVALAGDEGLAGLALRVQRVELLLKSLLGGFAGVDRAANGSTPPRSCWLRQSPASARSEPRARLVTPKT